MLYSAEIERYLSTLPGKKPGEMAGDSSKQKTRNSLTAFMGILEKNGRSWPDENDYTEYTAGKPDNKNTKQNLSRVRNFFIWLEGERQKNMTNEITQTVENEQNKRGRKAINGEIRKNKLTVYLTDSQNADFTALLSLKRVKSAADYVLRLIIAEIEKNEQALNFFREAEKLTQ